MTVKIISDSTCDLSPELLERYNIGIIPLYVIKDGMAYKDYVDIKPADIFSYVENSGDLCSTSAVSQYDYEQCFAKYAKAYGAVIQITLGSGFSSCYQNACVAAKSFDNVYVVDSKNLSSGQGHIVIAAAKMAASGLQAEEIVKNLNELVPKVEASFLIDRLDYMRKGGRCSAVAVLGANLLNLKPCIEVKDGKMVVAKKYRGTFEKCIRQYVKDRLEKRNDYLSELIFVTHAAASPAAVEAAKTKIAELADFNEVVETQAGCTIFCHCGPQTLGILFVRK